MPLWRSDYAFEPEGMQNHTYGLSLWVPYFGTGIKARDPYTFRSQMAPAISAGLDVRRTDIDLGFLRTHLAQWRQVSENYYGDFYPLTAYRPEADVWMAWQFNRPEAGEGMVQAFRRPESRIESMRVVLRGLDPTATYALTNLGAPGAEATRAAGPGDPAAAMQPGAPGPTAAPAAEATGEPLMREGLLVRLPDQPDSALIVYRRTSSG